MIQRFQTIYLLVSLAIAASMFIFPFAAIQGYEQGFILKATGVYNGAGARVANSVLLPAMLGLIGFISIITSFSYKNRKRQLLLCKVNLLIALGLIAAVFFVAEQTTGLTASPSDSLVTYQVSAYLPFGLVLMIFLAHRAIKKDEELVKSLDRLR